MTLLEMKDKRQLLKDELFDMIANAESQERKLNDDEASKYEAQVAEIRSLDEQIEKYNLNNNKMEEKNFSLIGAINAVINRRAFDDGTQDVINRGLEEMKKSGQTAEGQIVLPFEGVRSAIVAGTAANGGYAIQTDKWDILAPLRERLALNEAGCTFLTGCVNNFDIPAYGGTTVLWKGETAAAADGAGTFTEVSFSPKRLTAYVDVSKLFLNQTGAQAESMLMQDIANAVADKLEQTILGTSAGSATQPAGLLYNVDADASADALTYASVIGNISTLRGYKYNVNEAKWIVGNDAWATLHTTAIDSGSGRFILEDDRIDGIPVVTSGNIAAKGMILADWRELIIAQWGALDITVDPYTQATNGSVRLVVNAFFDAKFRRSTNYDVARVLYSA